MRTSAQTVTTAATIQNQLAIDAMEIISEAMLAFAVLETGNKKAVPGQLFCFAPEDVAGLYLTKRGAGEGLWFRLHDGRVFDHHGQPSETDPVLYEQTFH